MTTLIIDETKAQDIFAGLCQEMELLRLKIDKEHNDFFFATTTSAKAEVNDQLNALSGVIAEVESLFHSAPKICPVEVKESVGTPLKRPGRPKMTDEQRQTKIDELTIQKNLAKTTEEKLAIGKIIRRLRREIEA